MKLKLLTLILLLTFTAGLATAQKCATMTLDSIRRANNPAMGTLQDFENWMEQMSQNAKKNGNPTVQTGWMIPVIFHVIHSGEPAGFGKNISQAQILSQMDVNNKDFRGWNSDIGNIPSVWKSLAGDMAINFCMAAKDPSGNTLAEPGIERINRSSKGWPLSPYDIQWIDTVMKPATIWDPNKYLNIWITQPYDVNNTSTIIEGYAAFPPGSSLQGLNGPFGSNTTDGVVLRHTATGTVGSAQAPSNKGRTASHEIGHWMGLRHIWGDGTCQSDYVSDTQVACDMNFGCPTFPYVSCCANGPNGDMFMNYMDYTDDACRVMFTKGQATRGITAMTSSPMRINLTQSTVQCGYGVSVSELTLSQRISIYPNPSSGLINIDIALENATEVTIRVMNVLGEEVKKLELGSVEAQSLRIDLSGQSNGVYFVETSAGDKKASEKVVINKQ